MKKLVEDMPEEGMEEKKKMMQLWSEHPHFKKTAHLVGFGIFALAAFIGSSLYLASNSAPDASADTAATSVNVTNALPTASSTSIDGGGATVTLTENTTTSIDCTATITDNNGCTEIVAGDAVMFRTNVAGGSGCTPDDNDCYTVTCVIDGGSCTGGADLTATTTCSFDLEYFADPTDAGSANAATDWTCEVTPEDGTGTGTPDTDTVEMATLTALDVTSTIPYGTLALGADTGATNQTTTVTNTGNEPIDSEISGTVMTCTQGTIAESQQKYDVSDITYASLSNSMSGTPTALEVDLPQRTAAVVTDDVFWGLALPASGLSGSCAGTNTFTAITD